MKKLIILTFICMAIACTKQSPQLPANKFSNTDSTALTLQLANEKLIIGEDSIIAEHVQNKFPDFTKTTIGLWYKITTRSNQSLKVEELESCSIEYKIYNLQKELLTGSSQKIIIGKKQTINGIEEAVRLMNKGEKATLIIPWYLAYGLKGNNENIAPYTSLIVELELLK